MSTLHVKSNTEIYFLMGRIWLRQIPNLSAITYICRKGTKGFLLRALKLSYSLAALLFLWQKQSENLREIFSKAFFEKTVSVSSSPAFTPTMGPRGWVQFDSICCQPTPFLGLWQPFPSELQPSASSQTPGHPVAFRKQFTGGLMPPELVIYYGSLLPSEKVFGTTQWEFKLLSLHNLFTRELPNIGRQRTEMQEH